MYTAIDIAKYIINKCTLDGQPISNLQLQKILYFVQKAFLQSRKEAPLFIGDFEAWQFGPVSREVYYEYCAYGANAIEEIYESDLNELTRGEKRLLDKIIDEKKTLKPWDMVVDTHKKDGAWDKIFQGGIGNRNIIPVEFIRMYG